MPFMQTTRKIAGDYLRAWRGKRRMSQLELASEAEISTRHLSFLETGRSQASREMLLHLCEQLDIPLRERNVILAAAGYAPVFEERPLASPEMAAARQAVERVLKGHEPFPALAVDRHWQLVSANPAVLNRAGHSPQRPDCLAGHVRLELRNVVAKYLFERSH